jgi:PHD/YefM family antitoxin component YafN of YafNO toxin-antitoxin module
MKHYPLQQFAAELQDVLGQVDQSPVVLTEAAEPRYILLSVQNYQQLLRSLQALDDQMWAKAAQQARQESEMVESELFVAALQQILSLETGNDD